MATDVQTAEIVLRTALSLIGTARWKLSYFDWLEKVEGEDDDYWREKWLEFDELAKAVSSFDAYTLAKIVS